MPSTFCQLLDRKYRKFNTRCAERLKHYCNRWMRPRLVEKVKQNTFLNIWFSFINTHVWRNHIDIEIQKVAFSAQLKLAHMTNLPIVIHCRDNELEVYEILIKVVLFIYLFF